MPPIEFLEPDRASPDQLAIVGRVASAYRSAQTAAPGAGPDGAWAQLATDHHNVLHGRLMAGEVAAAAELLGRMFADPVTTGLAQGEQAHLAARADPFPHALDWHDKAIALGVAVGVLPAECPEQGPFGSILQSDSRATLAAVADRMGVPIAPPQVGAMYGVRVRGEVVPAHYLLHLYTAHRLKTLGGREPRAVAEVGGGVGFLACAVADTGAGRISVYDLPLAGALQGYVLLHSRRAADVRLYGEEPGPICLTPHFAFDGAALGGATVVNQDSLPEMGAATMASYLEGFAANRNGRFLSVNQEGRASYGGEVGQGWVHDACRRLPGIRNAYRVPYPLRRGYVEELYEVGT